ncbi:MAG: hypothetical protein HQL52_12605 [Magnetococcales bacterium]|nr:hypothetical protein [Magnetococcales bacterium]
MSVAIHESSGVRRINVLGEVQGEVENRLLNALAEPTPLPVEVSFYDASMVTAETILALNALVNRDKAAKIVIFHPKLCHYFHQLGLVCQQKSLVREPARVEKIKALALGGSADSLDKILNIIERLPLGQVAVFIVQHISEERLNMLDDLLRTKTQYALLMPHHMTPVKPGTIYIAPPGHHMRVHHDQVYLTRDRKQDYARPAIGVLFESLAREYGPHLVVALLCGYGRDGVDALKVVRKMKGLALVENSEECQAATLVEQAVISEQFDLIASWREIAALFAAAAQPQIPVDEIRMGFLLEAVEARYGYAFQHYAKGTLKRRITKVMAETGHSSFYTFQKALLVQPSSFEQLFLELSIGVTAFFRNPRQLHYLRNQTLPYLETFPHIRIWIAGCATGETAYSLAILLEEAGLLEKSRIYATDINPLFLQQARNGLYGVQDLEKIRYNYTLSGGTGSFDDYVVHHGRFFAMAPRFQENILFYQHSLVSGGVFNEFQLILCSNVIIYFNHALQAGVMALFSRSLHRGGFLVLGRKEGITTGKGERFFEAEEPQMKVFRWKHTKEPEV